MFFQTCAFEVSLNKGNCQFIQYTDFSKSFLKCSYGCLLSKFESEEEMTDLFPSFLQSYKTLTSSISKYNSLNIF